MIEPDNCNFEGDRIHDVIPTAVNLSARTEHLSQMSLKTLIYSIIRGALKMNDGKGVDSDMTTGRQFYYYSEDKIVRLADEDLALELIKKWTNRGKKESDSSNWTNFLYRKSRSIPQVKGTSQ
ncbi:MAG: hypothetical protein HC780_28360 [Leptolyngbyaceae cyanobacterium CSU_1_3]|nr:hypothetical protein [Leptolyngbyaceae cyanobacterium CSU_1_3]